MNEKKKFTDTAAWPIIRTLIEIAVIVGVTWFVFFLWNSCIPAIAEEDPYAGCAVAYVICTKDDYVNVRPFPNTKRERSGWLEPGDMVRLDGRKRNGYCHVVGLSTEAGEGWVHAGYLAEYPPELVDRDATVVSNGRVAARKYVGGRRTRWLKPAAVIHVWWMAADWSCTNRGYVQTKYLQVDGE